MGIFDDMVISKPAERAAWFYCTTCGAKVNARNYKDVAKPPHFNGAATVWAVTIGEPDMNDPVQIVAAIKANPKAAARLGDRLCYGGPSAEWKAKFIDLSK